MKNRLHKKTGVSICCITYNQKKYIRDAIEGFLLQKTSFPIEIIIHDDASTDGTTEIVKEYAHKFPDLIVPIIQSENQYSKTHGSIFASYVFPHAHGKYIALCEGDDYWTEPDKLQKQYDFLEKNTDYVMVADNATFYDVTSNQKRPFSLLPERDIDINELIDGRTFTTASVLFRNIEDALNNEIHGETLLWCYLIRYGKIRYRPNISSVYRKHPEGVTASMDKLEWARYIEKSRKKILLIHPELDKSIFNHKFFKVYNWAAQIALSHRNYKDYVVASLKCLRYDPIKGLKSVITDGEHFLIKKLRRLYKSKLHII